MEQNDALLGKGAAPESNPPVEDDNSNLNMETLLEEGLTLDLPQVGEVRAGVVASINPAQILVSIGAKSEGVITGRELEQIPAEERESFQVGLEIPVYVVAAEDANGTAVLSYVRAQEQMGWDAVEKMLEADEVYEGCVEGYNKGGLIVLVRGLRGFVPASQVSLSRKMASAGETPDQRWGKMVGEPISVRVIEVDRSRRRLILSERAVAAETRQSIKERVIEGLEEGEIRTGRVTSLADFGAFVNINGADGLVHLSEISWDRVQHPNELLEVGQEVRVKVISIDREKKRIGLSMRQLIEDPWKRKVEKFRVGQLVEGVITRLTKFGAFARIESDIEGLIHISEISEQRIEHPKERLHEGDVVALRIIRIDPEQRRIGLSVRKVDSGAYKDLDLKNIDLEGIGLTLCEETAEVEPPAEKTPKKAAAKRKTPAKKAAKDKAASEAAAVDEASGKEPTGEETSAVEAPSAEASG